MPAQSKYCFNYEKKRKSDLWYEFYKKKMRRFLEHSKMMIKTTRHCKLELFCLKGLMRQGTEQKKTVWYERKKSTKRIWLNNNHNIIEPNGLYALISSLRVLDLLSFFLTHSHLQILLWNCLGWCKWGVKNGIAKR